ncbi:MAG: DPP IV N-terminal domain-containing protein [Chloroflexota bacterium]|nr:DPP IV N-terminal domain-containing protein [Chloroflexota bacterium]
MRTQLGALLTLLLVAAAVVVGVLVGGATILSQPSPVPTRSLVVAPSRSPVPTETLAPDALHVFSVGAIPPDSRFVVVGDPGDERLLLLDLVGKKVTLAAHFEGKGAFANLRVLEITSTASSELFVIHLRADGPDARLYFIRPVTGEVRSFLTPKSESVRLSPDGGTIAVSRNSDDPDQKGLWLLNTLDGTGRRLTADLGRRATRAVQWSADGKRLSALLDSLDFGRELVVFDLAGNLSPSIAPASDARWRGSDLLFWNANGPGPVGIYTGTPTTGLAYPAASGIIIDRAEVRPRSSDLAVRERSATMIGRLIVYDSGAGASTVVMADAQRVIGFWWSSDASRLYAWSIDNETTTVRDVLNDQTAVTFCFRVKIAPPCG